MELADYIGDTQALVCLFCKKTDTYAGHIEHDLC